MDNVLAPYLTASDDGQRQQHLDELLMLRAAPLVRGVLLRRLGFHVNSQGVNNNNQDAEDLYQEAMTRVVQGLNQLQSSAGVDIENFELYVSRLASNLCTDFLREKSPVRTRLKYRLRDLLQRHKDLAIWRHSGETLCGFAAWRNSAKSPFSDHDVEPKLDSFKSLYFADEDVRSAPVTQIIAELFDWIAGPVEIDLLAYMLAYLLDLKDLQIASLDDHSHPNYFYAANTPTGEAHLEANELLARVWQTVIQLPAEQRDAFAFGFADETGQDLFTALLTADIVNWDELARGMGRTVEEVVRLRQRMPMDSPGMAEEMRASRNNVHKWRFRAVRRLKTDLRR